MPYVKYMPMLGVTMLSPVNQLWLRKAATMLAVFACLLIGTFGGDALALCIGEGHVAVELSAGGHDVVPDGVSSPSAKTCADATLSNAARVEKIADAPQKVDGKALVAAIWPSPHMAASTVDSHRLPQVSQNPALKHHRTVVLLN